MITYILKAKHWQLFAILVLPYLIPSISPLVHTLIGFVIFSVFLSWLWSIGVVLNNRYDFTLSNNSFKISVFYFVIYLIVGGVVFPYFKESIEKSSWIFFIPHIIAILSLVYSILFCARALKIIERGSVANTSECWDYFFLLFFFPIGVWILQPKINQMSDGSYSPERKSNVEEYKPNPAIRRTINLFVGLGILVFALGLILGEFYSKYFKILVPIGSLSTLFGSILFLAVTNLKKEFEIGNNDLLRYFWDKIILKFWTVIILFWMILVNKQMFMLPD